MTIKQTGRMASVALAVAMGLFMAFPTSADALSKRTKNTIGGAVVGAGVGHLVGGSDGAKAGAVVGAIAGNQKKK
ncbi:glycine zipper 2TM domain-containing protein [Meridianimarinicoccus aquatilis]|nr:glycine zipper 2TM domain-containing protein [Fluviibacterium aquatile]